MTTPISMGSDARRLTVCDGSIPVIGTLRIAASESGVAAIAFVSFGDRLLIDDWLGKGWHLHPGDTPLLRQVRHELAAWGRDGQLHPGVAHDHRHLPQFLAEVLVACRGIPPGQTLAYGALAAQVGHPGAARAVGTAMRRNPTPLIVPCHRVVAANGLGGFTPGLALKRAILAHEAQPGRPSRPTQGIKR